MTTKYFPKTKYLLTELSEVKKKKKHQKTNKTNMIYEHLIIRSNTLLIKILSNRNTEKNMQFITIVIHIFLE